MMERFWQRSLFGGFVLYVGTALIYWLVDGVAPKSQEYIQGLVLLLGVFGYQRVKPRVNGGGGDGSRLPPATPYPVILLAFVLLAGCSYMIPDPYTPQPPPTPTPVEPVADAIPYATHNQIKSGWSQLQVKALLGEPDEKFERPENTVDWSWDHAHDKTGLVRRLEVRFENGSVRSKSLW